MPVAGHQSNVGGFKPPADGRLLHLAKLLLGQCDQRRGVVGHLALVQGLEQRRFGNQRLAHARGRTHQHPLLGRKPRQQGLLLHRVRIEAELIQVTISKLVSRRDGGHGFSI